MFTSQPGKSIRLYLRFKNEYMYLFSEVIQPLLNNVNTINSVLKVWCCQLELLLARIERHAQTMRHIWNQCVRCGGVNTTRMKELDRKEKLNNSAATIQTWDFRVQVKSVDKPEAFALWH